MREIQVLLQRLPQFLKVRCLQGLVVCIQLCGYYKYPRFYELFGGDALAEAAYDGHRNHGD